LFLQCFWFFISLVFVVFTYFSFQYFNGFYPYELRVMSWLCYFYSMLIMHFFVFGFSVWWPRWNPMQCLPWVEIKGWWKRCTRLSFRGILISVVVLLLGALCFSIVLILSMCMIRDILEECWWRRGAFQRQRNRQSKFSLVGFIISFLLCTVKILISYSLCWKCKTSLLFFKVEFVIEIKTGDC